MRDLVNLRDDIIMLKAWIEHWQADARHGLPCTKSSLDNALHIANRVLNDAKRLSASQPAVPAFESRSLEDFRCDERKAKFSPGQRIEFEWVWFDGSDDRDGLPITFRGTVLRERGTKFVVQVDKGKTSNSEEVDPRDVFKNNEILLIKVGPANMRAIDEPPRLVCLTCYLVEGVAEDRCYGNEYYHPNICVASALVRARATTTEVEP